MSLSDSIESETSLVYRPICRPIRVVSNSVSEGFMDNKEDIDKAIINSELRPDVIFLDEEVNDERISKNSKVSKLRQISSLPLILKLRDENLKDEEFQLG